MKANPIALTLLLAAIPAAAHGAVTMSASGTQPAFGASAQMSLGTDATIPGGSFNQQAFSDNAGPPGQTFTTPSGIFDFYLNSFSYKGAANSSANFGGNVFSAGTTFGIRVSSVTGTTLTPLLTVTGIPTTQGALGDQWFTWTFSGTDVVRLYPSRTYGVEVFSSAGWLGFDANLAPTSYEGGTAFNSTGAARQFGSDTLQDRGYDRTFIANITQVPEPGTTGLIALVGGLLLGIRCLRRK